MKKAALEGKKKISEYPRGGNLYISVLAELLIRMGGFDSEKINSNTEFVSGFSLGKCQLIRLPERWMSRKEQRRSLPMASKRNGDGRPCSLMAACCVNIKGMCGRTGT